MYKLLRALALMMAAMLVVFMIGCGSPLQRPTSEQTDLVALFKEEGVVVVVPWQGKEVKVKKLPPFFEELPKQEEQQQQDPIFSAKREVINFEVVDANTEEMLTKFEPPIKLYVVYTNEDIQSAGGVENLRLAFWDNVDERWVVFTDKKHQFEMRDKDSWPVNEFFELPDDAAGFGFASVPNWDDLPIAWGKPE
ncbi:hypothetical protein H8E77_18455 [bacterium]|nr:hypothetical protein [bacterium]